LSGLAASAGGPRARLELVGVAAGLLLLGLRAARSRARSGDTLALLALVLGLGGALWARLEAPPLSLPLLVATLPAAAWVAGTAVAPDGTRGRAPVGRLLTRAVLLGALPYALDVALARNLAGGAALALVAWSWRPGQGPLGVLLTCVGLGFLVPVPALGVTALAAAAAAFTPAPEGPPAPPAPGSTPGRPSP